MGNFSPAYDNKIARKYSVKTLEHKLENKTAFQDELGWPTERKRPVLCMPVELTKNHGGELLMEILPGLLSMDMEILVLGKGEESYGKIFSKLAKEYEHRIAILPDTDEVQRKMYAAADMALIPPKGGKKEVENCLSFGVVPIAPETEELQNYDPVQESGNAFLYKAPEKWQCFAAAIRAVETQRFPFDWRTIQRHCMESVKE